MLSSERKEAVGKGKGMLLDTNVLRGFRKKGVIFRFGGEKELEVDVSGMGAEEAAGVVVRFVKEVVKGWEEEGE